MSLMRKTRRKVENIVAWILALSIIVLVIAGTIFVVNHL